MRQHTSTKKRLPNFKFLLGAVPSVNRSCGRLGAVQVTIMASPTQRRSPRELWRAGLSTPSSAIQLRAVQPPPYNATVLKGNGSELINQCLARRPWWRETPEGGSFNFFWASNGQAFEGIDWHNWRGPPAGQRQLINRCKGNGGITNKDRLCLSMRRHARAASLDPSIPLVPLSFILTPLGENEIKDDHELSSFREAASAAKKRGENMWIVKPALLNRGRGIQVFGSARAVEVFLRTKKANNHWVVQKYIERPLLVRGRKFDIRLLVLVTSDHRVWMYRDSYVRTSSVEYNGAADTADRCQHLVNDAVQSTYESYGTYEDANKLSLPELQTVLDDQPLDDGRVLSVEDDLWPAMQATVQQVFCCALTQHFAPAPPGGGMFELFGLDFMVEASKGQVLLIEVNTQPALGRHGHVLQQMIPQLLEETMQKAVDPIFPPPADATPPAPLDRFELVSVPPSPTMRSSASVRPSTANAASPSAQRKTAPTPTPPTTSSGSRSDRRDSTKETAKEAPKWSDLGSRPSPMKHPPLNVTQKVIKQLELIKEAREQLHQPYTHPYLDPRRRVDQLVIEDEVGDAGDGMRTPSLHQLPTVPVADDELDLRDRIHGLPQRGRMVYKTAAIKRPLPMVSSQRVWMHVGEQYRTPTWGVRRADHRIRLMYESQASR